MNKRSRFLARAFASSLFESRFLGPNMLSARNYFIQKSEEGSLTDEEKLFLARCYRSYRGSLNCENND